MQDRQLNVARAVLYSGFDIYLKKPLKITAKVKNMKMANMWGVCGSCGPS